MLENAEMNRNSTLAVEYIEFYYVVDNFMAGSFIKTLLELILQT